MKTLKIRNSASRTIIAASLAILFILASTRVLAEDYTKTYKEKYAVEKGAVLQIEGKFGDVHCQNWDESSISILVTVKVDASSQEKADKIFDKISVDLTGSPTKVVGTTTVGNINNGEFSIDYDIMMPKWINVDLDNQFGSIYIAALDGSAKINVEYGALDADALNGLATDLTIKFSEADVAYFKDGKVNVEYGGFKANETGNISITSRFSHVDIEKAANLNLDSQYDEIKMGPAGQVIVISRFSGMDFEKIGGSFEFDIEYGDMSASGITANFGSGKIRNSFANVDLGFEPKATFTIDAELEFGDLCYPKSASLSKLTEDYTTNIYKGKIGSSATPGGQLNIRSRNANVNISFEQ
jgi:hypothetical protein